MEKEEKEPEIKQTEEITTVGMFLKYTRLNKKKSVETVAKDLCIRKVYIQAIENDDRTELTPVPYGIGFVRSYAEYLDLNADRIVECYKKETMPQTEKQEKKSDTTGKRKEPTVPDKKYIIFGLIAICVIYGIWLFMHRDAFEEAPSAPVQEEFSLPVAENEVFEEDLSETLLKEEVFEAPAEEEILENEPEIAPAEQITVNEENYIEPERIVVKFKGDSWFEIKTKDKVLISGTYHKGFEYKVPNEKGLIFSVGKYYNVDVYVDGVLTKVAGPKKQTKIELDEYLKH